MKRRASNVETKGFLSARFKIWRERHSRVRIESAWLLIELKKNPIEILIKKQKMSVPIDKVGKVG